MKVWWINNRDLLWTRTRKRKLGIEVRFNHSLPKYLLFVYRRKMCTFASYANTLSPKWFTCLYKFSYHIVIYLLCRRGLCGASRWSKLPRCWPEDLWRAVKGVQSRTLPDTVWVLWKQCDHPSDRGWSHHDNSDGRADYDRGWSDYWSCHWSGNRTTIGKSDSSTDYR